MPSRTGKTPSGIGTLTRYCAQNSKTSHPADRVHLFPPLPSFSHHLLRLLDAYVPPSAPPIANCYLPFAICHLPFAICHLPSPIRPVPHTGDDSAPCQPPGENLPHVQRIGDITKTCDGHPGAHGPMTFFAPPSYTHPALQDGRHLRRHPGFGQVVSRAFALPTKG